jgi:hypothetical protein
MDKKSVVIIDASFVETVKRHVHSVEEEEIKAERGRKIVG